MYIKLVFRNLKRSFGSYIIYFLTLGFAVSIFYIFNAIPFSQSVQSSSEKIRETMPNVMSTLSIFISIVLGFLIIYANNFIVKKRSKEIGIYMLLGMNAQKISAMLFCETLLLGILALILGLLVGIFFSQGMTFIIAKIFEQEFNTLKFSVSIQAVYKTVLMFLIIFIVVAVFSSCRIIRIKIINLIQEGKKSEKLKTSSPVISICIFILSIIFLMLAYRIALDKNFQFNDLKKVLSAFILGSFGTYLFYFSVSGLMLTLLMKNKKLYYKKLNIFSTRQVVSEINKNIIMIATISIMLLITVCAFASGFGLADYASNTLKFISPNDFEFSTDIGTDAAPIEKFAKSLGFETPTISQTDVYISNLTLSATVTNNGLERLSKENETAYNNLKCIKLAVIKLSQYNNMRIEKGLTPVVLKSGMIALHVLEPELTKYVKDFADTGGALSIQNNAMGIEKDSVYNDKLVSDLLIGKLEFAVVNDEDLVNIYPTYKGVTINLNKKFEETSSKKIAFEIKKYMQSDGYISVKFEKSQELYGISAVAIFAGLYIGITFLIMSTALLALQQITNATEHKLRYETLRKIGADEKMIDNSIFTQIAIYFFAPMILTFINSAVALKTISNFMNKFGNFSLIYIILFTATIFTGFYAVYFATCNSQFKNILKADSFFI